jgi:hypothetical protein
MPLCMFLKVSTINAWLLLPGSEIIVYVIPERLDGGTSRGAYHEIAPCNQGF